MNILVTGGAGFIGGHIAEQLLRDGYNVTVLDSMHPFYNLSLKRRTIELCEDIAESSGSTYEFVEGDVRDASLVTEFVADADYVYHQAARAGVRDSLSEPRTYNAVNVDGTLNILDAARKSGIERIIMASSSSVYGGQQEYLPFSETDPTAPVSPYGASKLAAERYLCAYNNVYDIPGVALRYFTVYGPRMRPNMAISNFVSRCLEGKPPIVYGEGTQTRDFTYINDIIDANLSLLDTSAADGEALNIGSTDRILIRDLADEIREIIDPELKLEFANRFDADAEHTCAKIEKAKQRINYTPTYTIQEGLREFVDWYQKNLDWYHPLVLES